MSAQDSQTGKTDRGVVIGSYMLRDVITIDEATFFGRPGGRQGGAYTPHHELLDPLVRRSILYFDRIEWPTNNMLPSACTGYEVLEQQGYITHTHLDVRFPEERVHAMTVLRAAIATHTDVFTRLDAQEPGVWAFAPVGPDLPWWPPMAPDEQQRVSDRAGIEFSFYNSLPVPAPDVPYAEILDLKARRGPELHALREHLEKLYLSVINSNDIFRSQIVALRDLDASIATLARLMVESKLECLWQTLSVELLMEAGVGTATGAELAELGRQPVAYGAAAGLAGALYVFAKKRLKSVVSRAGPLAYLVHATHEEVIGSVRAP